MRISWWQGTYEIASPISDKETVSVGLIKPSFFRAKKDISEYEIESTNI